jgi:VanZ family protein
MIRLPMLKSKYYLIASIGWIGLIYATTPLVPAIQRSLVTRYGYSVYNYFYFVFILLAIAAFFLLLKQHGKQRLISFAGFVFITGLYAFILPRLQYGVEKIHFLEYGFLSFLLAGFFQKQWQDALVFIWILIWVFVLSLLDEAVQWLIPNRVAEISDVWLNVLSAGLGFLGTLVFMPAFRPIKLFNIRSFKKILWLLSATVIATSLFIYFIHGFGTRIQDKQVGAFFSSFHKEELITINDKLKSTGEISKRKVSQYKNEGARHLVQRDFYDTNKFYIGPGKYYTDWRKSHNENRILEKYYSAYLDGVKARWSPGYDRGQEEESVGWQSRVKSTVITSFSFGQMINTAVSIILFLLLIIFLLRKESNLSRKTVPDD